MTHPTIRWGILGTGNIAGQFARGLHDSPGAELIAVGSRSLGTARQFGRQFDVAHCHGSYADLVHDPDVDVVYVSTPHSLHRDNTLTALEAGKAVLCEKPLALNAAQATEMIALAREKQLFLMEGMWTRFLPPFVHLRQLLAEEKVGDVRLVSADLGFDSAFDPHSRLFDPALGGGALLDVGVYPISLATMILGAPDSISGEADICSTGVDEHAAIALRYPGGQLASLYASLRTRTPQQALIVGTRGSVHIHSHWWKGGAMEITVGQHVHHVQLAIEGDGYQYEANEVVRCLRAGKLESDVMPLRQSMIALQIMDELRSLWGLKYPAESRALADCDTLVSTAKAAGLRPTPQSYSQGRLRQKSRPRRRQWNGRGSV
jgi:predicted dehydrogenase